MTREKSFANAALEAGFMMKKKIILILLVLIFVFSQSVEQFAQQQKTSGANSAKEIKPETCELNNINLENADRQAKEDALLTGKSDIIILIARPGKKEKKSLVKVLLEQRLYTTRAYLTDYLKLRGKETVVTAEAPNNGADYGVIEIYVTGQLNYVLASNPNFGIGLGSCDDPESDDQRSRARRALLYPWFYKSKQKK